MKTYYWHIHHEVIAEPTEDIEERKEYVRAVKPTNQVAIRLRLMTPVKVQDTVGWAWKEYEAIGDKAREEYHATRDKARKEYGVIYDKAWKEYVATKDKALKEYNARLEHLHKKEHPDCPWDGKTIFPEKRNG